ncbi:MAG: rhodanese-like domain-containing protein [Lewinellaceae bacterium]|nr:rhodanese-like domain-containing protein [Lewinellaceae bacterium]
MNLNQLLQEPKAIVIDVREPWEFQSGNYPNSINIPLGQVPGRIAEIKQMGDPLILVCRSGARSGMATAMLQAQGARAYNGGAWDYMPAVAIAK